jgi:hypothetical protein
LGFELARAFVGPIFEPHHPLIQLVAVELQIGDLVLPAGVRHLPHQGRQVQQPQGYAIEHFGGKRGQGHLRLTTVKKGQAALAVHLY